MKPVSAKSRSWRVWTGPRDAGVGDRAATPLSLFFAGLIASCGPLDLVGDGPCGISPTPFARDVVSTEAEFATFAAGGPGIGGNSRCARTPTVYSYFSVTECVNRGSAAEGHVVFCQGERSSRTVCGRNAACHLSLGRGLGRSDVGRWLAFAAATEAASIRSFTMLRRELRALGAPTDLVTRAHGAARDEAKHTRWMLQLARERGGIVEWPRSVRLPLRDLETVAAENAVEGCVRETWTALLNHHQAAHARDPAVRVIMTRIAVDETAHAELARDIDGWAMKTLSKEARLRVQRSKRAAARSLTASLRDPAPPLRAVLGLPTKDVMQAFARALAANIWS